MALAGCGGSSRGAAPPATPPDRSLDAVRGPLDLAQQQHLLRRTCWGTAPQDAHHLQPLDPAHFVDWLLQPAEEPAVEAEAGRRIAYREHPEPQELVGWWTELMVHSAYPLRDTMAFFWHRHFATSVLPLETGERHLLLQQIEKLRAHGLGNVRELLHAMVADPALLIFLDAVSSTAATPNENLAREFFELFALGVDNGYTQQDIVEAARALTGYATVTDPVSGLTEVVFDPTRHDAGAKTIFGHTGPYGLHDLVDLTITERPVAEYLCRRLFEQFCFTPAPAEIVAELAAILRGSGYELRPVLRVLLQSRVFFAPESRQCYVKSPVEVVVGYLRETGLAMPPTVVDYYLTAMGQRPGAPPSVAGWPRGDAWLAAGSVTERRNFLHAVAVDRGYQATHGRPFAELLPLLTDRTPQAVVEALAARLGVELTDADVRACVAYLGTRTTLRDDQLVTTPDTFRGNDPEHLDERARGLLFILSQHPSYFLR